MIEEQLKKAAGRIGSAPVFDIGRAADERGLLDVAYATVDSPFGTFVAAATNQGLVRLALATSRVDDVLDDLSRRLSPRVLESPQRLDIVRRELDEYFSGRRFVFDMSIDWALTAGFNRKVLRATARIPYGSVTNYGTVARTAGSPRAARAAGNALHNNPIAIIVPCHRVLHANGGLGGYGGGLPMKEALLHLEGALDE
jgi:methylated-DNA-[protein]-cysteine S-methyltransferase